jgi:cytochrome c-type biogenesis protein CcmH/NrfG
VRRRLGRWAVAVGALAVIVAWLTRQRKAADAIRKSYETARERFEEAREQLSARGQERGQETGEESTRGPEEAEGREEREGDTTEGNKGYYRKVIKESMERSGLS